MAGAMTKEQTPYEITFKQGAGGQITLAKATCNECGATKEKSLSKHMPPPEVIKKFIQDGWKTDGHNRPKFICPQCQDKKRKGGGEVVQAAEVSTPVGRDPETGERAEAVGISVKSSLGAQRGMMVRIPYEVWTAMGSPSRVSAYTTDDRLLGIKPEHSSNGIKLQQQGQGQAWCILSPRRVPGQPAGPNQATKPTHVTAMLYHSQGVLVLPVSAENLFKQLAEWGVPMDNQKVVKLRGDKEPAAEEQPAEQPVEQPAQPAEQPKQAEPPVDLAQEGRDLLESLNDWVARMLEDDKQVQVTQDDDGWVKMKVRYTTEYEL